jgi:hypothetical protein
MDTFKRRNGGPMRTLPMKPDNCGNCPTIERSVTVRPYLVEPSPEGVIDAIRCYYRCPGCGHRWWTSWLLGADEMELDHRHDAA